MQDLELWDVSPIDGSLAGQRRVLIVGGGKMGSAILDGLANIFDPTQMTVCEPDPARRAELVARYPALHATSTLSGIEDHTYGADDWIIVAVKPQIISDVLDEINRIGCQALVISVAVGVPIAQLAQSLPLATVIRIMPNLPVMIGEGMVLIAPSARATDQQIDEVAQACFELGDIALIEEADIDICAAISGSGPAYIALVIDALERAAVNAGLSEALARDLVLTTVIGTADMIDVTGDEPVALAQAVQSPGGTTERAVSVLDEVGLADLFDRAVAAAIERARQLAEGV